MHRPLPKLELLLAFTVLKMIYFPAVINNIHNIYIYSIQLGLL